MPGWLPGVLRELDARSEALHDALISRLVDEMPEYRDIVGQDGFRESLRRRFAWFLGAFEDLANGRPVETAPLAAVADERRDQGVSLESLQDGIRLTSDTTWQGFVAASTHLGVEPVEALGLGGHLIRSLSELAVAVVTEAYLVAKPGAADPAQEFVASLTSPQAPTRVASRLCSVLRLDPEGLFLAAAVVTHGPPPARDPDILIGSAGEGYIAIEQHRTSDLDAAEEALADRLLALNPGAIVGIGLSRHGLEGAVSSIDDAERSLRAARRLGKRVLRYRTRWTATLALEAENDVRHVLEPLIGVLEADAELMATARSYLDTDGSLTASAQQLHVHPNTVRYRLGRIGELSGVDVRTLMGGWSLYIALTVALAEVEKRDRP